MNSGYLGLLKVPQGSGFKPKILNWLDLSVGFQFKGSTKFVNSWVTLQVVSKLSKGQVPFNITPHPLTRSVKCPNKKLCKHCKYTST